MHVCELRDHGFDARQCTPSEEKGQLHWLSLTNKGRNRMRVLQKGGSIMLPFYPIERIENVFQMDLKYYYKKGG